MVPYVEPNQPDFKFLAKYPTPFSNWTAYLFYFIINRSANAVVSISKYEPVELVILFPDDFIIPSSFYMSTNLFIIPSAYSFIPNSHKNNPTRAIL